MVHDESLGNLPAGNSMFSWRRSGIFFVIFENILHLALVCLLLTLKSKCRLVSLFLINRHLISSMHFLSIRFGSLQTEVPDICKIKS